LLPQACVAQLAVAQAVHPLAAGIDTLYVCEPFEHDPHDPTQLTGQPPVLQLLDHHLVSQLNVLQAVPPLAAGVVIVNVCWRFHPPQVALQYGTALSAHDPTQLITQAEPFQVYPPAQL
jgi:hypothetical protein